MQALGLIHFKIAGSTISGFRRIGSKKRASLPLLTSSLTQLLDRVALLAGSFFQALPEKDKFCVMAVGNRKALS
ncbi:hypothetical protein NIES2130_09875 [Scytonema sp. HK-05]|nr:hypothetical protein NIES2130_09875 [Scytonema sp. HK-05]